MKYFVIEGKFKTFEFQLDDEDNQALKAKWRDFVDEKMEEGAFLLFGGRAHGLIGLGRGENLDGMLAHFEADPLVLDDVIEYRIVEIEEAIVSDKAAEFFSK